MTTKKSLTWIFGILTLLTLAIVLIFTHTKHEEQQTPDLASLHLSSSQLSKYLGDEISHYLPIEKLDVAFFEDGKIKLDAVLQKEDVRSLLEKKQPALQYAAELLPEQINAHLALRLMLTGTSISVEPLSFQVASFDLTSWLSQELVDSFNRKIAQYFKERQIELLSLRVLPDAISMEIRRNFT